MKRHSILAGKVIEFPERKPAPVVVEKPDPILTQMESMATQIMALSQMVQDMSETRSQELQLIRETVMSGLQEAQAKVIEVQAPESTVDLEPIMARMESLFSNALVRVDTVAARVSGVGDKVDSAIQAIGNIGSGPSEIVFDIRRDSTDKPLQVIARSST